MSVFRTFRVNEQILREKALECIRASDFGSDNFDIIEESLPAFETLVTEVEDHLLANLQEFWERPFDFESFTDLINLDARVKDLSLIKEHYLDS